MNSRLLRWVTYAAACLTIGILMVLVGYILVRGVPYLTPSMFALKYTSDNQSFVPALVTTVLLTALALLIAVPVGVCSAIYMVEYAPKSSRVVKVVRTMAETLSGIPSIVYGLFGMLFFVTTLQLGVSMIAGALTVSIMILPLIMRSSEEALLSVSDLYREGSFGVGAGRLRTTLKIVLPAASSGILSGVILGIGRIVGETAALIFTAGTVAQIPGITSPSMLMDSGRSLAVHMYALSTSGLYTNQAYATAVVLLALVIAVNALAASLARRLGGQKNED